MEGVFLISHSSVLRPKSRPFTATTSISNALKPSPPTPDPHEPNPRRPNSLKLSSPSFPLPKSSSNPLKNLAKLPDVSPPTNISQSLSSKLRLSSRLFPSIQEETPEEALFSEPETPPPEPESPTQFRQEGKIFVGNLPSWVKKHEVAEFFRQFGPIKNVILIKGHNEVDRNAGFGFVIYGGPTAASSAMKAVEFDGVEFHGRVLTVKLDDGRRLKAKSDERARWVEGFEGEEYISKWHEEREGSRRTFRKIIETEPENWQKVVSAFERIEKVC